MCRNKKNQHGQQEQQAQEVGNFQQEKQLFVFISHGTRSYREAWLVASGCINRMIPYFGNFKKLDKSHKSKKKIENRDLIDVEGK